MCALARAVSQAGRKRHRAILARSASAAIVSSHRRYHRRGFHVLQMEVTRYSNFETHRLSGARSGEGTAFLIHDERWPLWDTYTRTLAMSANQTSSCFYANVTQRTYYNFIYLHFRNLLQCVDGYMTERAWFHQRGEEVNSSSQVENDCAINLRTYDKL